MEEVFQKFANDVVIELNRVRQLITSKVCEVILKSPVLLNSDIDTVNRKINAKFFVRKLVCWGGDEYLKQLEMCIEVRSIRDLTGVVKRVYNFIRFVCQDCDVIFEHSLDAVLESKYSLVFSVLRTLDTEWKRDMAYFVLSLYYILNFLWGDLECRGNVERELLSEKKTSHQYRMNIYERRWEECEMDKFFLRNNRKRKFVY